MIASKKKSGGKSAALPDTLAAKIYPFVVVPWAGSSELMQLKILSAPELNSCGDFNMFGGGEAVKASKNIPPEKALEDMIAVREIQDNLAKIVMISPSYSEVIESINRMNPQRLEALSKIDEMKEKLSHFAKATDPECKKAILELNAARAQHMFPLPEDTYGFLTSWATGADGMELSIYSKELMVSHAALAEKGNCRPCEIAGIDEGKDFLRQNYDLCCWSALHEARVLSGAMKKPIK